MADTNNIKAPAKADTIDLLDMKWKKETEAYVNWMVTFDELKDAYLFTKLLTDSMGVISNFDVRHSDLYEFYKTKLALARAVSLSMQREEVFLSFFHEDVSVALKNEDIDLIEKIDAKVINEIILEDRDQLKKKTLDRLVKNSQELTKKKITVGDEQVPPSIMNWLRHYNAAIEGTSSVQSLKQAEYLTNARSEGLIDEHERPILRRLIDVYEHLKLSSLTPRGLEENFSIEQDGKKKIVTDGRVEEVPREQLLKKINAAIRIQQSARGGTKKYTPSELTGEQRETYLEYRAAILEKVENLRAEADNDSEKIKGIVARALDVGGADDVTAGLYYLASEGELEQILVDNFSWLDATKKYAQKKFGSADAAKAVTKNPAARESLSLFFQYVLLERLKLPRSESALIGMDIGARMGSDFQGMAFWDQDNGIFDWARQELKDGTIVSEITEEKEEVSRDKLKAVQPEVGSSLDRLRSQYESFRAQRSTVLSIEDELLVRTKGDTEALKRELSAAVREKDQKRTIACLKILSAQKTLATSLKDSKVWFDSLADYIREKYSKKVSTEEIEKAIGAMKVDSSAPSVVSEFLQLLLIDKLGMDVADAALVASDIGQLLGSEYQAIAYGSEESGTFEWSKNEIKDGKLQSESNF